MPIELTIETRDLRKHYGQNEVLAGLTLKVQKGSICGFLGRNGAGKTTTLKLLMGLCRPTAGEGLVFGLKVDRADESSRIRQKTGFVSEEKLFPGSVTVRELLNFTRAFYPRWRSDLEKRYLREFELPLSASAAKLSKGMRSKLALLLVLPRGAELLLLDEPTEGLDPAIKEEALQALVSLAAEQGTTIFFSSHQIAEVERIADQVCIIAGGRVLANDSLDELKANYHRLNVVFEKEAPASGFVGASRDGRTLSMLLGRNLDEMVLRAKAMQARSVEVAPVTLGEIFLETSRKGDGQ
jgi:ABC-type multidrug transport system ATPase subunit